jgi:hypothetical protein
MSGTKKKQYKQISVFWDITLCRLATPEMEAVSSSKLSVHGYPFIVSHPNNNNFQTITWEPQILHSLSRYILKHLKQHIQLLNTYSKKWILDYDNAQWDFKIHWLSQRVTQTNKTENISVNVMCNMIMPMQDIKNFWHCHETSFQEIPVITEQALLFMLKWK